LLRLLVSAMAGTGTLLAAAGLWSAVTPTFLRDWLTAAPLSLALGVVLLVYTLRQRRLLTAAPDPPIVVQALEWIVAFVLVGLGLFWAAVDYSAAAGETRARHFAATLPYLPPVVLYSDKSLSLAAPGVTPTRCRDPQAAYHYRYDGLRLVLRSGDQYLLLPAHWTPDDGVAVLLPRTDAVRLEFTPRATGIAPAC
jgi:hypothetical protein